MKDLLRIALFAAVYVEAFVPLSKNHAWIVGRIRAPKRVDFVAHMNADDNDSNSNINRRLFVIQSGLAALCVASLPADASLQFEKDPINKRSGVKLSDAEKQGYNIAFVTYLTRFLLSFDQTTQNYWFSQLKKTTTTPKGLFSQLSASVEVGLQSYTKNDGPTRLLKDLVARYCSSTAGGDKRKKRESKEARRQLALLFALLEDKQPVREITQLLAEIDNGRVMSVSVADGITVEDSTDKAIVLPPPSVEGYTQAVASPQWKPTNTVTRVDVVAGGSGYSSPPNVFVGNQQANCTVKVKNGVVTRIQFPKGEKITLYDDNTVFVIDPPPGNDGETAQAKLILEQELEGIDIIEPGSGYTVEKPLSVYLAPIEKVNASTFKELQDSKVLVEVGKASVVAERSSYSSFRKDESDSTVVSGSASGPDDGLPPLPFWTDSSSSSDLLRLFPAGVGLAYDKVKKRYEIAADSTYQQVFSKSRKLGPEFGPRGRAPIEKDMDYNLDTLLRFAASGAVCASGVHLVLTPLDVLKVNSAHECQYYSNRCRCQFFTQTKVQTNPSRYETVAQSFQLVKNEEGASTFFTGWVPTFAGNLLSGGVLYVLTEVIRRYLSIYAGPLAETYEVPIILAAAATASAVGSVLICPFEAVRIRSVAQPNFAPNAFAVAKRLIDEEGVGSLVNAIPVFLVKNVPYAMTKFTIFDLSTEKIYAAYPATQEELKLSLLVSLIGGVLGGTAAAVISNPADCVISEIKKSKSSGLSALETAKEMLEKAGGSPAPFFKGLPLRMVYYSLVASLQFLVYDGVRFALGIGPDDLKLYLNVLGGALQDSGNPLA